MLYRAVLSLSNISQEEFTHPGCVRTYGMRRSGCFPEWSMEPPAARSAFRLVCVRVPGARHRGRARNRRGCQRVLAGRGELDEARSVFEDRRCVRLNVRGKHRWVLSGHLVWGSVRYVRVY